MVIEHHRFIHFVQKNNAAISNSAFKFLINKLNIYENKNFIPKSCSL